MPGLVKIGSTKRSPEERRRELSRPSGIPTGFMVAYEIFTPDMSQLEKRIHSHLDKWRVNRNREFFKINLEESISSLSSIAKEINLEVTFQTHGINEVFEPYEAIEILGILYNKYPGMIRSSISSARIYQTKIRCYLEVTEESIFDSKDYRTLLTDLKIHRQDLAFIASDSPDPLALLFDPKKTVSSNARIFIDEFDDYSKVMCGFDLFTKQTEDNIISSFNHNGSVWI